MAPTGVAESSGTQTVNVASLRPGTRLQQHLFDESGVLLLAANTEITPRFLELLRGRGVRTVQLRQAEPPRSRGKRTYNFQSSLAAKKSTSSKSTVAPQETKDQPASVAAPSKRKAATDPLDRAAEEHQQYVARAEEGVQAFQQATRVLNDVCDKLLRGVTLSSDTIHETLNPFTEMLLDDRDLLPFIMSMQKDHDEYLFEHSMNVALISMSMASQLNFDRKQLTEIGMCGFLQDIGMLRVPRDIRLAPRSLTNQEMYEIRCHPGHTVTILAGIRDAPEAARLVSYQVHERNDGSGYPGQRSGMYLHPFSKIVSIADAYSAMVRPRPHRDALTPYEAARETLMEVKNDRFDGKLVRAFLDSVSMFPIGSKVLLSDGVIARVVRSNPGKHTEPVVEELHADGTPTSRVVDLSRLSDVSIADVLS